MRTFTNFELSELEWRFTKWNDCAGNEITHHGENFVVIVNRQYMKIAQIYRTSANRYEIITACGIICSRTYESTFPNAAHVVKEFLKNAGAL